MSGSQTDAHCAKTRVWNSSVVITIFVILLCYSFWGNHLFTLYYTVLCLSPLKSMAGIGGSLFCYGLPGSSDTSGNQEQKNNAFQ